jgi:hypothetical protein
MARLSQSLSQEEQEKFLKALINEALAVELAVPQTGEYCGRRDHWPALLLFLHKPTVLGCFQAPAACAYTCPLGDNAKVEAFTSSGCFLGQAKEC